MEMYFAGDERHLSIRSRDFTYKTINSHDCQCYRRKGGESEGTHPA